MTSRSRIPVAGPADPRDLDGDFGHSLAVPVRFADTDAMGHVNNAVFLTFAEAARVAWWADVTGESILREADRTAGLILAEADIAYRAQVYFGETVQVETRATRIGRSSVDVEHRLTASSVDGPSRLVATLRSVVVRYDYGLQRPIPWTSGIVDRIEAFEGRRLRD